MTRVRIRNCQTPPARLPRLRRLARRALSALEVLGELSVALVDDAQMRALNRRYRRLDRATDVLAFPQGDQTKRGLTPFGVEGVRPPQGFPVLLGDVVLSVETIRRRSGSVPDRFERDLGQCLLHGILHLAGWDHHTAATRRVMRRRERSLWRAAWDDEDSGGA